MEGEEIPSLVLKNSDPRICSESGAGKDLNFLLHHLLLEVSASAEGLIVKSLCSF